MLFLGGIPGQIASLLARITNSTVPLNDARVGKIDYLDASILSRAPASTALSNTKWTDALADHLDADISSVAEAAPGSLVGYGTNSTSVTTGPGAMVSLGALTANTYASPVVNITSGSGYLMLAFAERQSTLTAAAILTVRITIDGTAIEITDGVNADTTNTGMCAVGYADQYGVTFDRIRFKASLKIEVKASSTQTASKVRAIYMYQLDA